MNLSSIPFLATAIAIIISWALFAIFCSLLHEALTQVVAERGRFMRRYLLKQLQDLPNGINWATLLYLHGSIDLLTRVNNKPTSYIPPELFAKTLVEVVGNSHMVQAQIQELKKQGASRALTSTATKEFTDEENNYAHAGLYNFKAAVQLLKSSDLVEFFGQSLRVPESLTPVTKDSSMLNPNSFTSCSSQGAKRLGQVMMMTALAVNKLMRGLKVGKGLPT